MDKDWLNQYWYVVLVVAVWELYWKAQALWRAANRGDKPWFGALLIINSIGILPIAYLYFFGKKDKA